jgi:hypothetical protein
MLLIRELSLRYFMTVRGWTVSSFVPLFAAQSSIKLMSVVSCEVGTYVGAKVVTPLFDYLTNDHEDSQRNRDGKTTSS